MRSGTQRWRDWIQPSAVRPFRRRLTFRSVCLSAVAIALVSFGIQGALRPPGRGSSGTVTAMGVFLLHDSSGWRPSTQYGPLDLKTHDRIGEIGFNQSRLLSSGERKLDTLWFAPIHEQWSTRVIDARELIPGPLVPLSDSERASLAPIGLAFLEAQGYFKPSPDKSKRLLVARTVIAETALIVTLCAVCVAAWAGGRALVATPSEVCAVRNQRGLCGKCLYPIAAGGSKCPECGTIFTPASSSSPA